MSITHVYFSRRVQFNDQVSSARAWTVMGDGAKRRQRKVDEVAHPAWRHTAYDPDGLFMGELTPSARRVLSQPA